MSGEINDWKWWIHPRQAIEQVGAALGCDRKVAIAAVVRRLVSGKITSVTGEYRGPRDDDNHLRPDLFQDVMILWRGLWGYDVFKAEDSPLWTVGDLEATVHHQPCFFFNIRLSRSDVDTMLNECGVMPSNDNAEEAKPALSVLPALRTIEPKWAWEKALAALVALADGKDGLDAVQGYNGPTARGAQAALAKWFAEYFSGTNPDGNHPVDSELRRRADFVLTALQR